MSRLVGLRYAESLSRAYHIAFPQAQLRLEDLVNLMLLLRALLTLTPTRPLKDACTQLCVSNARLDRAARRLLGSTVATCVASGPVRAARRLADLAHDVLAMRAMVCQKSMSPGQDLRVACASEPRPL